MGSRRQSVQRLGTAALCLALLPVGVTAVSVTDGPVQPLIPRLQVLSLLPAAATPRPPQQDRRLALPSTRTREFSAVGVTWLRTREVDVREVVVRTRSTGTGRWSRWRALPVEPGYSSAGGSRDGTTAMHVGGSDGVEVRVTARGGRDPLDLRVDLIDPGPAPAGSTLRPAAVPGLGRARVISRDAWGADPRAHRDQTPERAPQVVFVSRSLTTKDYSRAEAAVVVRGVQAFETLSRGWCDMGAAYVIDRFGRLFTGRAGPSGTPVVGQGSPGVEASALGVTVLGADSTVVPTAAQVTGLAPLLAARLSAAYADPRGSTVLVAGQGSRLHRPGEAVTFDVVSDRRTAGRCSETSAPDQEALARLRTRVAGQLSGALWRRLPPHRRCTSATTRVERTAVTDCPGRLR